MKNFLYSLFLIFFLSCGSSILKSNRGEKKVENVDLNWFRKEPISTSTTGIGIDKAYKLVENKKNKTIIIAILDTSIDKNHEILINKLWTNQNEIPNNNIDDDNNGYIDDINGWNFLGIKDNNSCVLNSSYESVRILRKYENNTIIIDSTKEEYNRYLLAKKVYNKELEKGKEYLELYSTYLDEYETAVKVLNPIISEEDFTNEKLLKIRKKDTTLKTHINNVQWLFDYDLDGIWLKTYVEDLKTNISESLNLNYDEGSQITHDKESFDIKNYGVNNISCSINKNTHATRMGGVIASKGNDKIGKGILNQVEIMPIVIVPFQGDEHDKDTALGIRYAVDNGAKVINMSYSKSLSYKSEWVFDAIKYAESKNVLLVTSAGNNAANGDLEENFRYPNDHDFGKPQVANNFLMVGSTGRKIDSTFVSSFSNYGKKNVDLFAPGSEFVTAWPGNKYKEDGGTSISSAVVAAVAGLVFQYYPGLTASQVKHILMDSGISYNLDVYVGSGEDKKKLPFKELSKSGKVVNAYNALLMAEEISKK